MSRLKILNSKFSGCKTISLIWRCLLKREMRKSGENRYSFPQIACCICDDSKERIVSEESELVSNVRKILCFGHLVLGFCVCFGFRI